MSLRDKFFGKGSNNKPRPDVTLSRKSLAASIAPILTTTENRETNAQLIAGFQELKELIRIAFSSEVSKGTLYEDLNEGLDHFIDRIKASDETAPDITFNGNKAFKFKDGSDQIGEAAYQMTVTAGVKAQREKLEKIAPSF